MHAHGRKAMPVEPGREVAATLASSLGANTIVLAFNAWSQQVRQGMPCRYQFAGGNHLT